MDSWGVSRCVASRRGNVLENILALLRQHRDEQTSFAPDVKASAAAIAMIGFGSDGNATTMVRALASDGLRLNAASSLSILLSFQLAGTGNSSTIADAQLLLAWRICAARANRRIPDSVAAQLLETVKLESDAGWDPVREALSAPSAAFNTA